MKLLTKTTLLYWGASLIGFLIAGFLVIQLMGQEMRHEVDEDLAYQQAEISAFLAEVDAAAVVALPMVTTQALPPDAQIDPAVHLRDSTYTEEDEGEVEYLPLRILQWQQTVGGKPYAFTIARALLEQDDALEAILWAMVPVILALSLLTAIFLRFMSQRLWRPFRESLAVIAAFRPHGAQEPHFPASSTTEFAQLTAILQQMTAKVRHDYQIQKAFAENAAHELQTPIAIVQAKLETLLQSRALTDKDMQDIGAMLEALQRMRRINQGLLMLTKIENRQFSEMTPLPIAPVVQRHLASMAELAALKGITIHWKALAEPAPLLNPILTDLLIGNLLANAIQHNHPQGRLEICLHATHLDIANTSEAQALDAAQLYQRFQKQDAASQGTGLGLAIVKEICEAMGLKISYAFQENLHTFTIRFAIQN